MYRVFISDKSACDKFYNVADAEWVTIILTMDNALLVRNTTEIFAALQLGCEYSANECNHIFKIPCSVMKAITMEGYLDYYVSENEIYIEAFNNNGRFCKGVTLPFYHSFTHAFKEKFELLSKSIESTFKAEKLNKVFKIAKALNSFIEVQNGFAEVLGRDGSLVFSKVPELPNFCISANSAKALFSCSDVWMCVENYVCAVNGSLGVVVMQSRGQSMDDYSLVIDDKKGSAAIFEVELSEVLQMCMHLRPEHATLNFKDGYCLLQEGDLNYKVPVQIQNLQVSEKYSGNLLSLDNKYLLLSLQHLGCQKVKIQIKKHYVRYDCDDFTILSK